MRTAGHDFGGFAHEHAAGILRACGTLAHDNLVSGLALCEVGPGRDFIHPGAHRLFTHEESVGVALKNDLATEGDVRQVGFVALEPGFVVYLGIEVGRETRCSAAWLQNYNADMQVLT